MTTWITSKIWSFVVVVRMLLLISLSKDNNSSVEKLL